MGLGCMGRGTMIWDHCIGIWRRSREISRRGRRGEVWYWRGAKVDIGFGYVAAGEVFREGGHKFRQRTWTKYIACARVYLHVSGSPHLSPSFSHPPIRRLPISRINHLSFPPVFPLRLLYLLLPCCSFVTCHLSLVTWLLPSLSLLSLLSQTSVPPTRPSFPTYIANII